MVSTVLERILNEEVIIGLVQLVAEEIDAPAEELATQLTTVDSKLADVRRRLERLYDALENSDLTYQALSPRILSLRQQEDQQEDQQAEAVAQSAAAVDRGGRGPGHASLQRVRCECAKHGRRWSAMP